MNIDKRRALILIGRLAANSGYEHEASQILRHALKDDQAAAARDNAAGAAAQENCAESEAEGRNSGFHSAGDLKAG